MRLPIVIFGLSSSASAVFTRSQRRIRLSRWGNGFGQKIAQISEVSLYTRMILRDPVHDLVRFETEEEDIIPLLLDTFEVQRLRRIRQLGVTHLVFPGAEHSRFTHAIGAAHVMTKLLRRLRELESPLPFWQRVSTDRARDALCAALLHDIGHGPYSHLFEQALPNAARHETWSLAMVSDSQTEVHRCLAAKDSRLPERVCSLIQGADAQTPYPLPYLTHAVSGTLDVDRCDYLLRDAYMTGVRYGLIDLDWLFQSLRFGPSIAGFAPRLAVDGMKGLPALEGFMMARRFMYEQVYLHKATRAAETLIKAIFARAAVCIQDGDALEMVPSAIRKAALGQSVSLGEYLDLDDITVGAAFSAWERTAPDRQLRELCARLRVRRLGKTIDLTGDLAKEPRRSELFRMAQEFANELGLDADLHVALDVAEENHSSHEETPSLLDPFADRLDVILTGGQSRPLVEASELLAKLRYAPIRRVRLIVAPEIRELVKRRVSMPQLDLTPVPGTVAEKPRS